MLEEIRARIDQIDDELVRLFLERLSLAEEIAEIKRAENLPIRSAAREQEIIDRLTTGRPDAVAGYIETFFAALFEISRAYQAELLER